MEEDLISELRRNIELFGKASEVHGWQADQGSFTSAKAAADARSKAMRELERTVKKIEKELKVLADHRELS
jgi:hypothetical protein